MLCSTSNLLKISVQQTQKAIVERQSLLARTNESVAAQVIECGIEKLKQIVEMHARTEKVLLLQRRTMAMMAFEGGPRATEALDDGKLDLLCDEAMIDCPPALLSESG